MLTGKVALVTGAGQGIGLSIAKALLSNGAKVSVVEVNEEVGKAACVELEKTYGADKALFFQCDVTDKEKLRGAFQQTVAKFGKLDIVCNNAGVIDEVNWRRTVEINLVGVIEGTYLGIEFMSTRKGGNGGHIINIASMAALVPCPFLPVYCATKAGVVHFTRSLKELSTSDGIFVNCVCPGIVETPILHGASVPSALSELAKMGQLSPSDVAECVLQILKDNPSGSAMIVAYNQSCAYFNFPPEQCLPDFSQVNATMQ